jgi:hypothetical protein
MELDMELDMELVMGVHMGFMRRRMICRRPTQLIAGSDLLFYFLFLFFDTILVTAAAL